jgi:hypothetical protein
VADEEDELVDPGLPVSFEGPAPFVNRMFLSLTPVTGRLAFIEVPVHGGGSPKFRAAVSMTVSDLVELRDLLTTMLKDVQKLPVEGSSNGPTK